MNRGADINTRDTLLRTPMHHASLTGSLDALQWLIDHGADQDAEDKNGMTPVQAASAAGQETCVEFLVTGVIPAAADAGNDGGMDDDGGVDDDFDDAAFSALMGM